jgi:methylmalonyl-CoA/ethylmalonyl-CoA epimerase
MAFAVNQIGQIGLIVANADASEAFYGGKFGVRLLLDQVEAGASIKPGSPIYFKVADIALARRELEKRGISFVDDIHMISPMEDHDLWMTFFKDPDEHLLALMSEVPKGYRPT